MSQNSNVLYHLLAILIVVVWGTTFISTKFLLLSGLSPAGIFVIRFFIAYLGLIIVSHRRLFCKNLKDEILMILLGLTGGSMYFLTENMSLNFTTTTNASLIVCSCPLFSTLAICYFFNTKLTKYQILGATLSFLGMAAVVLNGQFVLHLSPLGDLLAFGACLCWAAYSVIIRLLVSNYSSVFITRKVFAYGLISIIPWFFIYPEDSPVSVSFGDPIVWGNLLFLSLVASLACFSLWTVCIKKLGVIMATNYVYINPIATVCAAVIFLSETITIWFVLGSILILLGLWLHNKEKQVSKKTNEQRFQS